MKLQNIIDSTKRLSLVKNKMLFKSAIEQDIETKTILHSLGNRAKSLETEYLNTDISEKSKLLKLHQKEWDIYLEFKLVMSRFNMGKFKKEVSK